MISESSTGRGGGIFGRQSLVEPCVDGPPEKNVGVCLAVVPHEHVLMTHLEECLE